MVHEKLNLLLLTTKILNPDNKEMVEDIFVIAINKFIEQSVVAEEAEAKKNDEFYVAT